MHVTLSTGVGRDSSVSIATAPRAGRSGDRVPAGGQDSPHMSKTALGSTHSPVNKYWFYFPGESGRSVASSAQVKERVELYL